MSEKIALTVEDMYLDDGYLVLLNNMIENPDNFFDIVEIDGTDAEKEYQRFHDTCEQLSLNPETIHAGILIHYILSFYKKEGDFFEKTKSE